MNNTITEQETALVKPQELIEVSLQQIRTLTIDIVRKDICPNAPSEAAAKLVRMAQARGANPYLGEICLIKFKTKDGHEVWSVHTQAAYFIRVASEQPEYAGFDSGVIVKDEKEQIIERAGAFTEPKDILLGGWCRVYRKDRQVPIVTKVALAEYDSGQAMWAAKKRTMIVKVAEEHAHRKAFPRQFTGLYGSEELPIEGTVISNGNGQSNLPEPKSKILLEEPKPLPAETPATQPSYALLDDPVAKATGELRKGITGLLQAANIANPSEAQINKSIERGAKAAGIEWPPQSIEDCDKIFICLKELAEARKQ